MDKTINLFCPSCGHNFEHSPNFKGKIIGGGGGAITGAILGAKVGIAAGPLGAIAGTLPGAILGAIFGKDFGNKFDKPICPSCGNSFEIPDNLKKSFLSNVLKSRESDTAATLETKTKDSDGQGQEQNIPRFEDVFTDEVLEFLEFDKAYDNPPPNRSGMSEEEIQEAIRFEAEQAKKRFERWKRTRNSND